LRGIHLVVILPAVSELALVVIGRGVYLSEGKTAWTPVCTRMDVESSSLLSTQLVRHSSDTDRKIKAKFLQMK
jgi:hypothetical protein